MYIFPFYVAIERIAKKKNLYTKNKKNMSY